MTWVIVAALALGALGLLAEMLWTTPPGGISPRGIGLGLCVTLLGGVGAAALISVDVRPPPEQRGIGVVVEGIEEPTEQRAFDAGLTLSMAAEVDECGEPVDVRLTLAPTAEFWIDNRRDLARSATVRFAIPDGLPADADVGEVLDGLRAWTGNGFAPFATGVPTDPVDADLELTATKAAHAVFAEVDVPRWGEVLTPLTLRFRADWTSGRSVLEGCYVTLPAVAGLPTVLSTAQLTGDAYARDTEDDDGTVGVFVVVSEEAGLEAGYDAKLEVAAGSPRSTWATTSSREARPSPRPTPTSAAHRRGRAGARSPARSTGGGSRRARRPPTSTSPSRRSPPGRSASPRGSRRPSSPRGPAPPSWPSRAPRPGRRATWA